MELNEIIQLRKDKLTELQKQGLALYESFTGHRDAIGEQLAGFREEASVVFAGRITARRSHGKVSFFDLKDSTGKIQLYIKADIIGRDEYAVLEHVDIADIITVKGELFKTHTGEPTLKVRELTVLAKALRPLPEKWHGLKDVDIRYRRRYLDLISNREISEVFRRRSAIVKALRCALDSRGFHEVETPMMHDVVGGAAGRPFKTYHNEYERQLYLRIAPELYLKRLLVGGMEKIYEINRSFRNEGVSTRHNPEFTMLEVYEAYSDCEGMMKLTEELLVPVAEEVLGTLKFSYRGREIDMTPPWQRSSFADMVRERFDIEAGDEPEVMLDKLKKHGLARDKDRLTRSQVNTIIEDILEQDMSMNPTFVTDYFTALCPLAKTKKDNPLVSERFELYIGGMEIGNAYSELNDPLEQKRRFEQEIRELAGEEKKSVDEDYILALEHGMPPAGGLG
ncbi:MAG: lysine--tRNA ligase, partial [Candidatus Omnitrophica bacterium]|nr:lysine--tRNA ligase [Candidatus Omnitrophota bacterium]